MAPIELVLLHSPLVGPSAWQPLLPALDALGYRTIVPNYADVLQGDAPYYDKIADAVRGAVGPVGTRTLVLVAHSGAGGLVPLIGEALRTAPALFVDALLPHPGKSWFDTAPEEMRAGLRGVAQDGRVPPWNHWWPPEAFEALLPDAEMRARFAAELSPLPLAYFEETAPQVSGWQAERCAYLQLSAGYKTEADWAEAVGWPVQRLDLSHFAMATNPGAVAAALGPLLKGVL